MIDKGISVNKMKLKFPYIGVRQRLFEIYRGTCQYCHQRKDFNRMVTEHIISRFMERSKLCDYYKDIGELYYGNDWTLYPVGDYYVYVFPIVNLKPPRDCLANYILACRSCNASKGAIGDNLNPNELIHLLKLAYNNSNLI